MNQQIKNLLTKIHNRARMLNDNLILQTLKINGPFESILDVGCWDGTSTKCYAKICKAKQVYGIEIVREMCDKAKKMGIKCFSLKADCNKWPFAANSIDCIISNQVIEHLSDLDHFFSESSRVLKQKGFLIISTNNLSSWHNIFANLFGWAPFDLTNSSNKKIGIGNPFAIHRGEKCIKSSWAHKCIYTPHWLLEWQKIYGFEKISHSGAGFYPFPATWGNIFKNHAAFMIITTQKNKT